MEKRRIYYWDNLKAVLIFLVVLGHFLLPVSGQGKSVQFVYFFIYLFHMPAFVFVTGYFAKYYMKKDVPQINKLMGFLILFLVYKGLLWAIQSIVMGEMAQFDFFVEEAAPWYLLCMFFWYIYLPVFDKFKPVVSIGFAIILSILIGLDSHVGTFLCFSRCVVFLPFFLGGYYFKEGIIEKITTMKTRIIAVLILAAAVVIVFLNLGFIDRYETIIYGSYSYFLMKTSNGMAMMLRGMWYIVAMVLTIALMCLIPKRKTPISYIGSRTLSIYIIHRLIRQIFESCNLYKYFDESGIQLLIVCTIVSIAITFVCSEKHLANLFQKAFQINYDKLLRKK